MIEAIVVSLGVSVITWILSGLFMTELFNFWNNLK